MSHIARNMVWGLLGATTTRATKMATRRAMHTEHAAPRLPRGARRKGGLGMVLLWAAGTGALLALADVLREQRKDVMQRAGVAQAVAKRGLPRFAAAPLVPCRG